MFTESWRMQLSNRPSIPRTILFRASCRLRWLGGWAVSREQRHAWSLVRRRSLVLDCNLRPDLHHSDSLPVISSATPSWLSCDLHWSFQDSPLTARLYALSAKRTSPVATPSHLSKADSVPHQDSAYRVTLYYDCDVVPCSIIAASRAPTLG